MIPFRKGLVAFCVLACFAISIPAQSDQEKQDQQRQEEIDHYAKWLNEDVVYIISDEERSIFQGLTTPEEKEQFVEQFWQRRDPDLSTAINEFKEEHYRRISFANERFTSAIPGWKTDRGRVYILHGPPQELESRPTGGAYTRPLYEGGGTTGTYPFEIWRYRHLEGVGFDIELTFVDPTFSEEFRLAMRPEEKDAFLNVGGGDTLAEEMGIASKEQRPYFNPADTALLRNYPFLFTRAQDMPFQRYERYAFVNRAPEIKYPDLKEIVNVNISYRELPIKVRKDYFRLNERQVLVPITIEFPNSELTFSEENGLQVGKVAVYGIITSLNNRVVAEFDDDYKVSFPTSDTRAFQRRSIYQKVMPLDSNTRYKLDLVVKDLGSGKVGVTREAIIPTVLKEGEMGVSTMILSTAIRPLQEIPDGEEMFVVGDVLIIPILNKVFYRNEPLGIYLQVYNVGMDQSTFEPSISIRYQVLKDGEVVSEFVDEQGLTVQFASPRRVVLIGGVPVQELEPGPYRLAVEVKDLINDRTVKAEDSFELKESYQVAQAQ